MFTGLDIKRRIALHTAVSSEAWAKLCDWASVAGKGRVLPLSKQLYACAVRLAERSKAPDLSSGTRKCAWVRTPHLTVNIILPPFTTQRQFKPFMQNLTGNQNPLTLVCAFTATTSMLFWVQCNASRVYHTYVRDCVQSANLIFPFFTLARLCDL